MVYSVYLYTNSSLKCFRNLKRLCDIIGLFTNIKDVANILEELIEKWRVKYKIAIALLHVNTSIRVSRE